MNGYEKSFIEFHPNFDICDYIDFIRWINLKTILNCQALPCYIVFIAFLEDFS